MLSNMNIKNKDMDGPCHREIQSGGDPFTNKSHNIFSANLPVNSEKMKGEDCFKITLGRKLNI